MPYRIGSDGIAIGRSTVATLPDILGDFAILCGDELVARYPFMPGRDFKGQSDVTWVLIRRTWRASAPRWRGSRQGNSSLARPAPSP